MDKKLLDNTKYLMLFKSLLYLLIIKKPNISFAVSNISRFYKAPQKLH